jgi:hypothetical protein
MCYPPRKLPCPLEITLVREPPDLAPCQPERTPSTKTPVGELAGDFIALAGQSVFGPPQTGSAGYRAWSHRIGGGSWSAVVADRPPPPPDGSLPGESDPPQGDRLGHDRGTHLRSLSLLPNAEVQIDESGEAVVSTGLPGPEELLPSPPHAGRQVDVQPGELDPGPRRSVGIRNRTRERDLGPGNISKGLTATE